MNQNRFPKMPEAFRAGWNWGYFDGGEHDCRMFEPTAQRAWEDYCLSKERNNQRTHSNRKESANAALAAARGEE